MGATPRVLADDMLSNTKDEQDAGRLADAMAATTRMRKTMLAKQNVGKSTLLSSTAQNRTALRAKRWGPEEVQIATLADARDLGSHH